MRLSCTNEICRLTAAKGREFLSRSPCLSVQIELLMNKIEKNEIDILGLREFDADVTMGLTKLADRPGEGRQNNGIH